MVFSLFLEAKAPCWRIERLYVRLSNYSYKEIGESKWTSQGKRLQGETVCAVTKESFLMGTRFYIPVTKEWRIVGDTLPTKSANKHIRIAKNKGISIDNVVDLHYDSSIKAKSKTKNVDKELREKDLGYQEILVYYDE